VTLDPGARVVGLSGGRELPYEACLLATGAEPTRLPVPGADQPAVRVIRSLDHVRDLHARLAGRLDSVAVIGSGFIGCEIAASLRLRGHPVSLLSDEAAPNAARLGEAAGKIIGEWLAGEGVELHLGCPVERIDATADGVRVKAGQTSVAARVAVMAAGVTPRAELAAQAGLELVDGGAIAVDTAMRATGDGLLAAGDVCRAENRAAGRALRVEHWGDALAQGEVAGRSVAGADAAWDAVPGFWSTIGRRTLKYAAWGDGYDESRLETGPGGSFVVRYGRGGALVGVLTHESDDAYEAGAEQIAAGARWT
jgi:NADPH-dependent 2,4-dienoyl-CoA reductase/sulfur reductase-like enzyme